MSAIGIVVLIMISGTIMLGQGSVPPAPDVGANDSPDTREMVIIYRVEVNQWESAELQSLVDRRGTTLEDVDVLVNSKYDAEAELYQDLLRVQTVQEARVATNGSVYVDGQRVTVGGHHRLDLGTVTVRGYVTRLFSSGGASDE